MGTKTVIIEVATRAQEFPIDTVDGLFKFELLNAAGELVAEVETEVATATFSLVQDGASYTIRVSKNEGVITQEFTLEATSVMLQVPDVIRIVINP